MKKLVVVVAVLMLGVFTLFGCADRKDVLTVYTNAEFPPFEYHVGTDVVGVDMDIMKEVGKKLNKKIKIEDVQFDTIVEKVKGSANAVGAAGITRTEKREKQVDFTDTYYTAIQYILCKKADADSYTDLASLSGKRIATQKGTTGDMIIDGAMNGTNDYKQVIDGGELKSMQNAPLATQAMISGQADVVVIDKLPAEALAKKNSGLVAKKLVDEQVGDEAYGIIVQKGNTELLNAINEVIAELKANGKIDEFILAHTGEEK